MCEGLSLLLVKIWCCHCFFKKTLSLLIDIKTSHCDFNLHFPSGNAVEHFHVCICHQHIFSGEVSIHVFCPFFKKKIFIYFQTEEGTEKDRERNINVWWPLMRSVLGTRPATQACALTGNLIHDPLVLRLTLHPLSRASQGSIVLFLLSFKSFIYS